MFNKDKKIRKLEREVSKIRDEIPDEGDIENIVAKAIEEREDELEYLYDIKSKARQESFDFIRDRVDAIAQEYIERLVKSEVKNIQDKLLVELARKAMNMEEKWK